MANGKWIDDVRADTPLEAAARLTLTVRLDVVRHYLPLALHEGDQDPEHVHQLRVGTRRARAALDIFSACLPGKVLKTARKHLRKIRRAAGEARDWDVFLDSMQAEPRPAPRHRPGSDLLVGYALAQRASAQRQLEALAAEDYQSAFDAVAAETAAKVQPADDGGSDTLLDLAQPLLSGLVRELSQAAEGPVDDYAHLHQVRIIGKRLRYAMEVFAECFMPAFRESVYPRVEEMQEILGLANDSHVAVGRLDRILARIDRLPDKENKRLAPGVAALRKRHVARLGRQVELFKDWWPRWQESAGEEAFARLLKAPGPHQAAG